MIEKNQFIIYKKINKFMRFKKVVYIDCQKYKNTEDVMKYLWHYFKMPKYKNFSADSFLDWFRDGYYLKDNRYIFILKNFDLGFNGSKDYKRYLLEMFMFHSIYWWNEDVCFFGGGDAKKQIIVMIETKALEKINGFQIIDKLPVSIQNINIQNQENDCQIIYTYYNHMENKIIDCEINLKDIIRYYEIEKKDDEYNQYIISNFYRRVIELDDRFVFWFTRTKIYCFMKKNYQK